MRKKMSTLIEAVLFVFLSNTAYAHGPLPSYTASQKPMHYIRAGAVGSANGSDWTNAWHDLPATFDRDHVYFVAGGVYGPHTFDTPANGTSEIYIVAASEADHGTDAGWDNSYDDTPAVFTNTGNVFSVRSPFWVFDGKSRTTWTAGYHLKIWNEATKNVSLVSGNSSADYIYWSYVEFQNHDSNWPSSGGSEPTNCSIINCSLSASDNWTIDHCYLHENERFAGIKTGAASNWLIQYTYSKQIRDKEWWSIAADRNHTVRHNIFEDCSGSALIAVTNGGPSEGLYFYGNIVFFTGLQGYDYTDDILGDVNGSNGCSNWHIYNNTFVDIIGAASIGCYYGSGSTNVFVHNNVWFNTNTPSFNTGVTHDYNAHDSNLREAHSVIITSAIFKSYASRDFSLSGTFPSAWAGTPLAAFATDINGKTRGADGVWDRGAYEYDGGGSSSSKTTFVSPKNLRLLDQPTVTP